MPLAEPDQNLTTEGLIVIECIFLESSTVTWLLFCVERRVRNIITLTVTEITAGGMI
jgi:hypothetical protein